MLAENITEPLLIEMLLCPLMWYGNAREERYGLWSVLHYVSQLFLEGFARPYKGVRLILKHLVRRFRSLGGELKLLQRCSQHSR